MELPSRPPPELAAAIDSARRRVAAPGRIPAVLTVLSVALECAALFVVRRADRAVVREVELVPLVEGRCLVVLEMSEGPARVAPVHVPEAAAGGGAGALQALRAGLRWIFVGRTLARARARVRELEAELAAGRAPRPPMGRCLGPAVQVGLDVCRAHGAAGPRVEVAGRAWLARRLGGRGERPLVPALDLLDDPPALADLIASLEREPGDTGRARARVRVGPPPVPGVCLVACPIHDDTAAEPGHGATRPTSDKGGESARKRPVLALLGPQAMDFTTVIPLVEYAARTCSGVEA